MAIWCMGRRRRETLHLPSLLRRQSQLEVGCIDIDEVRGGVDALARRQLPHGAAGRGLSSSMR